MIDLTEQFYQFGNFRLDVKRHLLLRNGKVVPLTPKAFETLTVLVQHSGQVVEKEELLKRIWPDTFVEEGSLTRNISVLRKILGEGPADHQFIETVPKRGYRFVASIKVISEDVVNKGGKLAAGETAIDSPSGLGGSPNGGIEDFALISNVAGDHQSVSVSSENENKNGISDVDHQSSEQPAPALNVPFRPSGRRKRAMVLTASVLLLLVVFYAYRQYAGAPFPQQRSQNIKVVRFTNTGKSIDAAISPDGKFVVHVQDDAGQQSLWVKQVATSSDRQVIPPADVSYQGLAFSHDGNYICYNLWDKKGVGVIYKVPVLGGVPTKLVFDVMPSLAISPGSKHIAFVRSYASRQEQALIIADFDGTSEKTLLTRKNGSGWFGQPAWSPDGKTIACPVGSIGTQGTSYMHVVTVPSEGGAESPLSSHQWLGIGGLAWLSDGGRLIMTATDQAQSRLQIWSLSYPLGEEQKITNDVNGYGGVSLTSDSTSLVTVQSDMMSNIWVTPRNDPSRARKATSAKNEGSSLTWTPDNRIVYVSGSKSDNPDIWIMDHDGSNKKQLTDDIHADFSPSVTGDGRYIVFVSNRTNSFHLWRMRLDGSNQEQITNGLGEWLPNCSPTGNWVVYLSYNSGKQCLWKVSLDGGEPVLLNNFYSYLPAISSDGQEVAYTYWNEEATPQQLGREIISLHGAQKGQQFEIPTSAVGSHVSVLIKWASDGQALTYINNQDGISNIWRLPLDGALPQQLTDFKEDSIFWFDWSRDGEWLACSRGTITSDAILISDFAK